MDCLWRCMRRNSVSQRGSFVSALSETDNHCNQYHDNTSNNNHSGHHHSSIDTQSKVWKCQTLLVWKIPTNKVPWARITGNDNAQATETADKSCNESLDEPLQSLHPIATSLCKGYLGRHWSRWDAESGVQQIVVTKNHPSLSEKTRWAILLCWC